MGRYKSKGQLPDEVYTILAQVWSPSERGDHTKKPTQVASGKEVSQAEVRAANLLPRVYFHIVNEGQRPGARELEEA